MPCNYRCDNCRPRPSDCRKHTPSVIRQASKFESPINGLPLKVVSLSAMVEIFKTNIEKEQVPVVVTRLHQQFPHWRANVDLHDCDKVLRVEGEGVCPQQVMQLVHDAGHLCQVID